MQRRGEEGEDGPLPSLAAAGILGSEQGREREGRPVGSSTEGVSPQGGAVTAASAGWLEAPPSSLGLEEESMPWRNGEEAAELGLFIPHLVLATSSLEDPIPAYLCPIWFLEAQRSISAEISAKVIPSSPCTPA